MIEYAHLWVFFVILLGVVMLPGLDMAYVLGSALTGGRRHGLVAVSGIVAGGVVHVAVGALGLAALFNYLPGAFNAVLAAGALYLAWIGLSLLRAGKASNDIAAQSPRSGWATFRQATAVTLLNPKAYLFMLAIFPQFLKPEYGVVWIQAIVLGIIIAFTQTGVYGSVAFFASGLREWMQRSPAAGVAINRAVGVALLIAAFMTALDGWRNF